MKYKLVALFLLGICLGGLFYTGTNFTFLIIGQPNLSNNQQNSTNSHEVTSDTSNGQKMPLINQKMDPLKVQFQNPIPLTLNMNTSISSYPVDNVSLYPTFNFYLTKGFYLNLTVFGANWLSSSTDASGNITTFTLDIDFTIFFNNQTPWINATSNNLNEVVTTQIPVTGNYFLALYPYESDLQPYGSQISKVLIDQKNNLYNTTYYGGVVGMTPYASWIRLQMVDEGYAVYGNNLNLADAKTSDVLSRMPELRPSQTTWLWEYQKFLPSINDLYKVYVPKNTSITVIVSYNDTKYATRITANTEVLSLINYNDYVSWLYGTYTGSFKTVGTNYFGGLSYQYLAGSYISNLKSTSNSYYILSINNSYLSDAYTFTYNISLDFNDYIDNSQTFPNNNFGNATDYIRINNNYTLYTSSSDSDYFKITPVSSNLPQKLTLNLVFDRNYGKINLYLYNSTNSNETLSMVGKSDFTNQNQQIIEFNVFDITTLYIKVNTSAQYSNSYNLSITLGPIDDQYEPNDNPLQSATLFQPGVYNLYLAKNNWDYFRIFLFNQDQLNATIQFDSSIANIYLYVSAIINSQQELLGNSTNPGSNSQSVAISATENGFYYVAMHGLPSTYTKPGLNYKLIINIVARDDYLEQNDNKNQAVPIQDGFFQLISRAGDEDWFDFFMRQNDFMTIKVTFDTSIGDIDIFIYDKAVTTLYNSSQSFINNESFSFIAPSEGEYLIRVALFDGQSVNYNMNITLTDERYDSYEDNDNFQQAKSISPGLTTGIIAQGGDHDFFTIAVPTGYALIVELKEEVAGTGKNFALILYTAQEVEYNRSERNLNTQYIYPVAVNKSTFFYIDAHYKGFGKLTYSLNITIGLTSSIFPSLKINYATSTPPISTYTGTNTTTTSGIPLFGSSTLLLIGLIGIGGGAAAGVGGTIISQKTQLGTKIKSKFSKKK